MNDKTAFEEMMDRLPSNIKETEVLRDQSKRVLAALLELYLHSKAKETKLVITDNGMLRQLSGIGADELLPSIYQLEDYELITRRVGEKRKKGKKATASEYIIHFKNLKKPLEEKTFEDYFADELEETESSETSMSIAIATAIPITTSTTTSTSTLTSTSTTATTLTSTRTSMSRSMSTKTSTETSTALQSVEKVGPESTEIEGKEEEKGGLETMEAEEEEGEKVGWLDKCFLDPRDFEEDDSFLEDLNKRVAYARWDSEEEKN